MPPHVATISQALTEAEIGNRAYYTRPIHHHPAMAPYADGVELPMTDALAATHLAIPMNPFLTAGQAAEVTRCVEQALAQRCCASPPASLRSIRQ